jgi:hypothetical protein
MELPTCWMGSPVCTQGCAQSLILSTRSDTARRGLKVERVRLLSAGEPASRSSNVTAFLLSLLLSFRLYGPAACLGSFCLTYMTLVLLIDYDGM